MQVKPGAKKTHKHTGSRASFTQCWVQVSNYREIWGCIWQLYRKHRLFVSNKSFIKIKWCNNKVKVVPIHVMQVCRDSRAVVPLFLILAPYGAKWSTSGSGRCSPWQKPDNHVIGGWVGTSVDVDVLEQRKLVDTAGIRNQIVRPID